MAVKSKSKKSHNKGGGKLSRSEIVTIRLDPRLRYGTEIAARKDRRTVSSFIEIAIEDALKRIIIEEDDQSNNISILKALDRIWDVDEPDRFIKFASDFPDLLTHEEQTLWKLINSCKFLWGKMFFSILKDGDLLPYPDDVVLTERLHASWELLNEVANDTAERITLENLAAKNNWKYLKDAKDHEYIDIQ